MWLTLLKVAAAKTHGWLITKMLSRVAHRLFWLARYIERTENTARTVNVYSNLLFDLPTGTKLSWATLIEITGSESLYLENYTSYDERSVMKFLVSDKNNPSSILSCLHMVRENARTSREILPAEFWEKINELHLNAISDINKGLARKQRFESLQKIISGCQLLVGMLSGTMSNNAAYDFMRIGRNLERADMGTRIIDMGCTNFLPVNTDKDDDSEIINLYQSILWMNILVSLSGFQAYRQHISERVNGYDVVNYLLKDSDFPRAVMHCLNQIQECLEKLPDGMPIAIEVEKIKRSIRRTVNKVNIDKSLHNYIDKLQKQFMHINDLINEKWCLT
ncbi:MAG: alpha-E domain-containing protein [Pseudomonadota bacterium]